MPRIFGRTIVPGSIGTVLLAPLSVTSAILAAGAVIAGKIAAGAINASNLFTAGVVDSAALGTASVTTVKVGNSQITAEKLAAGAINAISVNGVDETVTPSYTVNGVSGTGKVLFALQYTTAAAIASCVVRPAAHFQVTAANTVGVIGGAVNNTGNQMVFFVIPA